MNKRCCNCAFRGDVFKPGGKISYAHCEHPKYSKEAYERGEYGHWDTLKQVLQTCEDWELKTLKK